VLGQSAVTTPCTVGGLAHLAAQNVAVLIELDTIGFLTAYLAEHMRFNNNATLKFAVGIVRQRFAVRALYCLTVFHPELMVPVEFTTFYCTARVKLDTDVAIQLGSCVRRENQTEDRART
jgi:hypothetical protein